MNTQERKVMELALEVIQDYVDEYGPHEKDSGAAHTLMKLNQALEQSAEQEPVAWKPDRSGKYLTVVYRDVIPGDEVGAIIDHPKCVIMSWSNAVHDVEQLKNTPQRQWVGLTDEEKKNIFLKWYGKHWAYTEQVQAVMDSVEAKLKEKNERKEKNNGT